MKRPSRGFTLIELMVALTVLGVLMAISVPTFRQFTRNNSITAVQNDLVTSFNLARSEALRRNRPVSVCASADNATCGAVADWNTGWIAFIDRGAAGVIDSVDDVIVQTWQSPNPDLLIAAGVSTFVQYLPTGMSAAAVRVDVSWIGCTSGPYKRRIDVLATGGISGQLVDCAA
ncbi:MAG TPA: GspH/FimT family pseudopilin [Steroidobacteraceae bacterium]|nr:GspH/FimT family pseudopilin [Steroidobacteraceae bacterium]